MFSGATDVDIAFSRGSAANTTWSALPTGADRGEGDGFASSSLTPFVKGSSLDEGTLDPISLPSAGCEIGRMLPAVSRVTGPGSSSGTEP